MPSARQILAASVAALLASSSPASTLESECSACEVVAVRQKIDESFFFSFDANNKKTITKKKTQPFFPLLFSEQKIQ